MPVPWLRGERGRAARRAGNTGGCWVPLSEQGLSVSDPTSNYRWKDWVLCVVSCPPWKALANSQVAPERLNGPMVLRRCGPQSAGTLNAASRHQKAVTLVKESSAEAARRQLCQTYRESETQLLLPAAVEGRCGGDGRALVPARWLGSCQPRALHPPPPQSTHRLRWRTSQPCLRCVAISTKLHANE